MDQNSTIIYYQLAMFEPKVSIIIPIYNTECFVEEAVRSVMNQTLKDIEIILVNDGSTDNSLSIIQSLAAEDPRLAIISQKNQGLSVTRNEGLKIAKGKYLYFMDSDDAIEKDTLEICYLKCENTQADFVLFDASILNDENININLNYQHKGCIEDIEYSGKQALNILIENHSFSSSVCLHFIKTSYLKEIRLSFYPHILHEDQLFTCLLYLQAKCISYIHKPLFKRRIRDNSIMTRTFTLKNMCSYFTVTDQLLAYASKHYESLSTVNKFLSNMLNAAVWLSYRMKFKDRLFVAKRCIFHYKKYVSTKNILILLFKSFIKK